jgi:hypothetical protein
VLAHPVAVAADVHDVTVVQEAVDQGCQPTFEIPHFADI